MLPGERLVFSAATHDQRVAKVFDEFGTRQIGPARMFTRGVPLALAANARHALGRRRGGPESRAAQTGAGSHA
jgi:hypothetical protein